MKRISALVIIAALVPFPALAGEPICYTQRTTPDNVVLPKPKATTMALPEIHLPDAATRKEPVSLLLQVTVSPLGRVDGITIAEGSKIPDWDAGVLTASKEWAFVPGTEDGEPIAMCIRFRVTATLQE